MTEYNDETSLKKEAEVMLENYPELKLDYELKNWDKNVNFPKIPIKHAFYLGLYFLNKKLVRYALDNDPEFKDYKTSSDRENANFHNLNRWLGDEYAEPIEIKYATLTEKEDGNTTIWFLQWTDNEEELKKLHTYIETANSDDYRCDVLYNFNIEHLLSKQTVEEICKVHMLGLRKLSGTFIGLGVDYSKPDLYDLDCVFYSEKKEKLFV